MLESDPEIDAVLVAREAASLRESRPDFARWAAGYGVIRHSDLTQWRVHQVVERLLRSGVKGDGVEPYLLLEAADRLACAGMWLTAHQTYARRVYLDGRDLRAEDFKRDPQGHLGGALNLVPAYVGYLASNALTGHTRSWLMGQGHAVGGVDSVNFLVGNMTPAHAARYSVSDEGLSRFARDFYSYAIDASGRPDSPLGSHVNVHTAGGISEGGYLGFAELQYVHMPLPGERLVTFLSDGAFEEQRGGDWAPRWWRPTDCGLVVPIMIQNGRRIDQRTTMAQSGGTAWFMEHLRLNGFDPLPFDGTDPAAFVWAILEGERREEAAGEWWARRGKGPYQVRLPHGIASAPKGYGFYGAGTNPAHNLPLPGNPRKDEESAALFNDSARRIWVPPPELEESVRLFQLHERSGRPREKDHRLATRDVRLAAVPPPPERSLAPGGSLLARKPASPMAAVDESFVRMVNANPHLRPRVGNPDEMRSNRLIRTLETLKFRVTDPEPGVPESIEGAVITALNEEAVAAAALANKGGINLIATYEAFGTKMYGLLRQEAIFSTHLLEAGRPPGWLSVPVVLTSHTWENSKNEQSHQDPTLCESMMGELAPTSRVLFAADHNSAAALMEGVFQTRGQIWSMVVAKQDAIPDLFTLGEARSLLAAGAAELESAGHRHGEAEAVLTAIGAYQLIETIRASVRLSEANVPHRVVYMLEPGRFRTPRAPVEAAQAAGKAVVETLYPAGAAQRVFLTHTRPEPIRGVLSPLVTPGTGFLGFLSRGGTLSVEGLLFVNRSTWAHVLAALARIQGVDAARYLGAEEREALAGRRSPQGVIVPAGGD